MDSYPDIAVTARFQNITTGNYFTGTSVLINMAVNDTISDRKYTDAGDVNEHFNDLTSMAGETGELVTFVDVDEDGRLDFLLQKLNKDTN